jgi:hypothetical protein
MEEEKEDAQVDSLCEGPVTYPGDIKTLIKFSKDKQKGRRNIERPRKRWRDQLHLEDQGTGNTPDYS